MMSLVAQFCRYKDRCAEKQNPNLEQDHRTYPYMPTSSQSQTLSLSRYYQLIINNAPQTNLWLPLTSALTADQARHIGLARRASQKYMARSPGAHKFSASRKSPACYSYTHFIYDICIYPQTRSRRETNHATCFQDQRQKLQRLRRYESQEKQTGREAE